MSATQSSLSRFGIPDARCSKDENDASVATASPLRLLRHGFSCPGAELTPRLPGARVVGCDADAEAIPDGRCVLLTVGVTMYELPYRRAPGSPGSSAGVGGVDPPVQTM